MDQDLLIRNGFIEIGDTAVLETYEPSTEIATILSNLASYGYTLDRNALDALMANRIRDVKFDLGKWWKAVEKVLKSITGSDRNMGDHIVYKNFPKEALQMDQATQIFHQFLIYWGVPYDALREPEAPRPPLGDVKKLKVLALADSRTSDKIYANLVAMRNRWTDNQAVWAAKLVGNRNAIVMSEFGFKENGITLAAANFDRMEFDASSGTDVLRLCSALSQGDISLREKVKFRSFKRSERRRLLTALDSQKNLAEDFASRPEQWKRLLERLRPGDYKFENVKKAYDDLYNKRTKTFGAHIDPQKPTLAVLEKAVQRPGEFLRAFHRFYKHFGKDAVSWFIPVMDRLTTQQLVSLRGYLRTINSRQTLMYPPKANWSRVKVFPNNKAKIAPEDRKVLEFRISQILKDRLATAFPEGVALDMRVDQVKLQTNDQKLAEYGRGTEFDIPQNIKFIRSASYWERKGSYTTWYDNGWNFFGENWHPMGACAWNAQNFKQGAAIFSGDPVNTGDLRGRACQMADLYLDRLESHGVRYAVWNILCYSRVKFSEAAEVLATLQMGENAETGRTYEPSRAQMVFPLKSEAYTSYVAYIDVKRRKVVYMDAPLPADTTSATYNGGWLQALMPAYVEYLSSLPTVLEVLQDAPQGTMPVVYDDEHMVITEGRAFVFRPLKAENKFERVSVTDLVNI